MMEDRNLDKTQIALKLHMPFVSSIRIDEIPRRVIEKVPYTFARRHLALPIQEEEGHVVVALADPCNFNALDELHFMLDCEIRAVFVEEKEILLAIHACYHHEEGSTSKFIANLGVKAEGLKKGSEDISEVYDLLEIKEEAPVIRLLNLILSEAIEEGASDIHFEPFEEDLNIRYRIDGVLQKRHAPHKEYQAQLLTRIKVLAKLDIAEHRLPQDGRIKLKMGGREIDIRVSTIPVANGERIVLRILDKGNIVLGLEDLGMFPAMLDDLRRLISLPEGIILVTGPTGSGKTTTLYSAISELHNDEINIMTVEDPVEYKLKGIAQISVHPKIGLNFAQGLRHILRQDPDVVMIGEIRDGETAEIAIQAAMTGHLVLSTLHTNDAPSALPRLMDMGIEPYLLSSTIAGVLAQRLVRRICPECREGYAPSDAELFSLQLTRKELNGELFYKGRGCDHCFQSGYKGRQGLYELMEVTEALQGLIAKKADAPELRRMALSEKMVTLRDHGAHLVKRGITTVTEVLRVSKKC